MVCHFFTLMVLARVLDVEAMGVYAIAMMMTFLLKLVSDFGVDLAFVKLYPQENEQGKSSLLRSAVALRILFCALVSVIYIGLEASGKIAFLSYIQHLTALTLTLYWLHSFRELILRVLQAEQRFVIYAGTQVLAAVLKAGLIMGLLLLSNVDVAYVLSIEIFSFIVSITYAAWRLRPQLASALHAHMKGAKELLNFGYPLYLNALLNLGNEKVSQYIVAAIGGPIAMAFFSIAERLSEAGTRLFESFANVYLPAQTNHFAHNDKTAAAKLADRSMLWIAFIIGTGLVCFAVIREPIMVLIFTDKYLSAANAALMFIAVLLLRSLQTLMAYYGVAAGEKFLPIKVSLVSSVFNIAMCAWLFSRYGYQGAIAALVFTQLLMNILYYIWLRQANLPINAQPVMIVVLTCACSVAWVYAFDHNMAVAAIALPAFVVINLLSLPGLRADTAFAVSKISQQLSGPKQKQNTTEA